MVSARYALALPLLSSAAAASQAPNRTLLPNNLTTRNSPEEGDEEWRQMQADHDWYMNACYCEWPSDIQGWPHITDMRPWSTSPDAEHVWARPDRSPCLCGEWCPYICDINEGLMPNQWDETPGRSPQGVLTHQGIYCDANAKVVWPRPNEPACVPKAGLTWARSLSKKPNWMCTRTFPGNDAPVQPVGVRRLYHAPLPAADATSYWPQGSNMPYGIRYYVNEPGLSMEESCQFGSPDDASPRGLYAPYMVDVVQSPYDGKTYVTMSWNERYLLQAGWPLRWARPSFGLKLNCWWNQDGDCGISGCSINPTENAYNELNGAIDVDETTGHVSCTSTVGAMGHLEVLVFEPRPGDGGVPEDKIAKLKTGVPLPLRHNQNGQGGKGP